MESVGVINDKLFHGFYKNKRVLITGHTGFKGSWLAIWLKVLGAEVAGYALEPYTSHDNFVMTGLQEKLEDNRGDIRNIKKLEKVFSDFRPQIVFHLAAQPLVRESYLKPRETYEINVMGTMNVLECIRDSETVTAAIMVTSDKCYENMEQIWGYREKDPMGGHDPYSSSKGCAELLINSYRRSFLNPADYNVHGKALASVRAGNVIGGGDWCCDRLVPDCMRALVENRTLEIRNPDAVRPWQHVLDALYGYLLLASKMPSGGPDLSSSWNFGPDKEGMVPVRVIADKIIKEWKSGNWEPQPHAKDCHEAGILCLDCTKARTFLGWKPGLSLDKAVEYTVEWYKNYLKEDMYKICVKQIESYCRIAAGVEDEEG